MDLLITWVGYLILTTQFRVTLKKCGFFCNLIAYLSLRTAVYFISRVTNSFKQVVLCSFYDVGSWCNSDLNHKKIGEVFYVATESLKCPYLGGVFSQKRNSQSQQI
jgi:hypothetical protein